MGKIIPTRGMSPQSEFEKMHVLPKTTLKIHFFWTITVMKTLWIAWEKHRRTLELASTLNNVRVIQLELEAHWAIRYPLLISKTIYILVKERPDIVIVQNPSVILSLFMVTLGKLFTHRVVVDAHNAGLRPLSDKYKWLLPIYNFIQRTADLTIVTNKKLYHYVKMKGGNPFILQDKIPQFIQVDTKKLKGQYNLVFICTFGQDEPYKEVVRAARMIDPSIVIYITGRKQKAETEVVREAASNVIFTDFLPDQKYLRLLNSCDGIIDLTKREDCLVCGAYEAIALNKPMILSNSDAIRNYFSKGVIYTENDVNSIAEAMISLLGEKDALREEVSILRTELNEKWSQRCAQLVSKLASLTA